MGYRQISALVLIGFFLMGCQHVPTEENISATPMPQGTGSVSVTSTSISNIKPPTATTAGLQPTAGTFLIDYKFPVSIDPEQQYLFYLHGKIIEDQGIPAVSPVHGEYAYEAILKTLASYSFVVISEQRSKDADGEAYARKVKDQVGTLLKAGVPANRITIVGASKGAGIAVYVSDMLENGAVNYVLLAICNPDAIAYFKHNQIHLYGNVLSVYDAADELAGSCQELFTASEGKGFLRFDEVRLTIGKGHGILYQPLEAWIAPTVRWATFDSKE
jgi:hypothetical protein